MTTKRQSCNTCKNIENLCTCPNCHIEIWRCEKNGDLFNCDEIDEENWCRWFKEI